jgi:hypothetical protein
MRTGVEDAVRNVFARPLPEDEDQQRFADRHLAVTVVGIARKSEACAATL